MDLESCSRYFCVIHYTYIHYILYTYTDNIIRTRYTGQPLHLRVNAPTTVRGKLTWCAGYPLLGYGRHPFAIDVGWENIFHPQTAPRTANNPLAE